MKNLNLSLYLVASRGKKSDEAFLNCVKAAILGGVSVVQLREKELEAGEFFKLGLKLKKLCDELSTPLIINDRIDLALALDAAGVHLGQEDLPVSVARKILGVDKIIGLSLKNLAQMQAGADYLGCGALRATPTKKSTILSLESLREIAKNSPLPVVAIGGIDEDVVASLRGLKLAGVAVVRAIMEAKNPRKSALRLKGAVCENLSLK